MANPWREHPKLRSRLHPSHPDDVQVTVHDGGPRMTGRSPETVWVRVVGMARQGELDVFAGEVLNKPDQLALVRQGARVQFVVPASGEHPVLVRPKYLAERAGWVIHPCNQCGLSELLDAPSDLIAKTFPDLPPGSKMDTFTAICGACGGVQAAERVGAGGADDAEDVEDDDDDDDLDVEGAIPLSKPVPPQLATQPAPPDVPSAPAAAPPPPATPPAISASPARGKKPWWQFWR